MKSAMKLPEKEGQTMRLKKNQLALFALLATGATAGILLWTTYSEYSQARTEYRAYAEMSTDAPILSSSAILAKASDPYPPAGLVPVASPKRFHSSKVSMLEQKNPDTAAWLEIPGTGIAYPVVQADDNDYYVDRTFDKRKNASGAIFMDCWNTKDFSDFNTVIYGHNMQDGSMFNGLRHFESQPFADQHLWIEITRKESKLRYKVFAAYVSEGEDVADFRGQACLSEYSRATFIKAIRKRAVIASDLTVRRSDRLLTLATCTGGTHSWYFVVHAVLIEETTVAE